jgi:hypothetical protein
VKLQNWHVIVGIVGGALTIVWIAFQFWAAMTASQPELVAIVKNDDIGLPDSYLRFLQDLDMSSREEIKAIADAAKLAKQEHRLSYNNAILETLKKFGSTEPVLRALSNSITTIKVVNKGRRSASNVRVFLPTPCDAEIQKDGSSTRFEETKGRLELQTLEPGIRCVVRFWSEGLWNFEDIRVVSDEGVASRRLLTISEESHNGIADLGLRDVLFLIVIGLMALALIWEIKERTRRNRSSSRLGPGS